MARPRSLNRPVTKKTTLPEDLVARVELELYSEAEGCVPRGVYRALLIELLTDWLDKRAQARARR